MTATVAASVRSRDLERLNPAGNLDDLPETFWAWTAGILDGEGSVYVTSAPHRGVKTGRYYRVYVGVSNTDRAMMDQLARTGGALRGPYSSGKRLCREVWRWQVGAAWLRHCGPRVLPYLVTKKVQFGLAIDAVTRVTSQDELVDLKRRLSILNVGEERYAARH